MVKLNNVLKVVKQYNVTWNFDKCVGITIVQKHMNTPAHGGENVLCVCVCVRVPAFVYIIPGSVTMFGNTAGSIMILGWGV